MANKLILFIACLRQDSRGKKYIYFLVLSTLGTIRTCLALSAVVNALFIEKDEK